MCRTRPENIFATALYESLRSVSLFVILLKYPELGTFDRVLNYLNTRWNSMAFANIPPYFVIYRVWAHVTITRCVLVIMLYDLKINSQKNCFFQCKTMVYDSREKSDRIRFQSISWKIVWKTPTMHQMQHNLVHKRPQIKLGTEKIWSVLDVHEKLKFRTCLNCGNIKSGTGAKNGTAGHLNALQQILNLQQNENVF